MRRTFACLLQLTFTLLLPMQEIVSQWVPANGPYGGTVNCFSVSDSVLLVGTDIRGVFRSTDHGDTWNAASAGLTSTRITGFAVAPDGTDLFVGTTDGVYRSIDHGSSWTATALTATSPGGSSSADPVLVFMDTLLFALAWNSLYYSADKGASWTDEISGLWDPRDITCLAVLDTLLFAGTYNGVFRLTADRTRWAPTGLTESGTSVRSLLAMDKMLFAILGCGAVFRSTDAGTTWVRASTGLPASPIEAITVSGNDLFAATAGVVYRSVDSGATWTAVSPRFSNSRIIALAAFDTLLLVGTAGDGVFRTSDQGLTWTPANTRIAAVRIYALAAAGSHLFAGTYQSGVFCSTDNGTSWIKASIDARGNSAGTFAFLDSTIFAGTSDGVFLSSDNGNSWEAANAGLPENTNVSSLTVTDGNLFAGTFGQGIFRSSNAGVNWTAISTGLPVSCFVHSLAVVDTLLFAGISDGNANYAGIYLSSNSGANWKVADAGLPAFTYVESFVVNGTYLFAGTNHSVFLSTDNGTSWTAVNTGLPAGVPFPSLALSGRNLFAGNDRGGVFLSADSGKSWGSVSTGLPNSYVTSLAVSGANLFAGTLISGLWQRPLSEIISGLESGSLFVNVRNHDSAWPSGWSGIVRLFNSSSVQVDSALIDPANGTSALMSGLAPGSDYFIRVWCSPLPATVFGEEFWGRMDNVAIEPNPATTSVTFTCNTPQVSEVRAYDQATGREVTGDTVALGTMLRLTVKIENPMQQGGAQTLFGRLILDGDKSPLYAFDSTLTTGVALPAGDSAMLEFRYRPQLLQPYYAAAAALISFFQQPTVTHGQPWGEAPLVTVVLGPDGVAERLSELGIPRAFALNQNYPNPFNPQTTIRFGLPRRAEVHLTVYTMLGQQVAELVGEELPAGYHEVQFDGSNLATGVYLYRMVAGEFSAAKRLVLVK